MLRQTFASQLAMRGVPIPAVQSLMGHSNIETTIRYAHLSPQTLDDAVNVLERPIGTSWHAQDRHHLGTGHPDGEGKPAQRTG